MNLELIGMNMKSIWTQFMTPNEIYPPVKVRDPEHTVMLVHYRGYTRRIYPSLWHHMTMYWQIRKYCKNMSVWPMEITLWEEKDIGNDILLGIWRNGKEIEYNGPQE